MQPRKGKLTSSEIIWSGTSWMTRTTSTSTPTCPTTSLAPMEEVRFRLCSLHSALRYPEAFSVHRDPEAHIPSEEQGRQQRQTGKNSNTHML